MLNHNFQLCPSPEDYVVDAFVDINIHQWMLVDYLPAVVAATPARQPEALLSSYSITRTGSCTRRLGILQDRCLGPKSKWHLLDGPRWSNLSQIEPDHKDASTSKGHKGGGGGQKGRCRTWDKKLESTSISSIVLS
ncbi:hypothetical protein DPV78_002820 [Talaromyces pinophilus]|nr:hypothetical protein DPV78_002820 [Talaromyces pinophilus]